MPALLALCAIPFSSAHAGPILGEVLSQSAIGEPLRIELRLLGGKSSEVSNCLRIPPGDAGADGIAYVSRARLSMSGQGANARLVVTQAQPVAEPIVRLVIDDLCAGGLRREYTLLLSFPEIPTLASAPSEAATAEPERARSAASARLASQAAASPAAASPREAPSRRTAEAKPAPARRAAPPAARPAESLVKSDATPRRAPPPPPVKQDRLVLMGEEEALDDLKLSLELSNPGRVAQTSESERELLRREQRLTESLDRSIVAQMELNHRLARLEEIQAALSARLAQTDAAAAPTPAVAPPVSERDSGALSDWLAPAALFAGLSLFGAALLWLYQHRLARRSTERELPPTAYDHPTLQPDSEREEPSFIAPPAPDEAPAQSSVTVDTDDRIERLAQPLEFSPQDDFAAPAALPEGATEEHFDEHESAVELADIMLSLGRVRGAAETLSDLVQRAPKHSLTPWIKLLKTCRMAGMRAEFETLASQLNKTFNVEVVTWDEFDEQHMASDSVEQMAHIIRTLQKLWGKQECQAYLDHLLRDNRDGTRQGFPLGVTDDLLTLAGILEAQLGRFVPKETSDDEAAAQTSAAESSEATAGEEPPPPLFDAAERA